MDLSIIIVNYNTKDLLLACLKSIDNAQTKTDSWEVIVVDNGSTDGSVERIKSTKFKIRSLKIIEKRKNLGFAKGNNAGIKVADGRYVLLLNSDTEVEKWTLQEMVKFMDRSPEAGISTCKVILPDGSLDPACHRGFPTPWAACTYFAGLERLFPKTKLFLQYHQYYKNLDTIHEIDSPSGAFFLVRREVINSVGMLDENFFMYGEDLDWSYRIKNAGWKVLYNPNVQILHRKKQSGRTNIDARLRKTTQKYFFDTMKLFYKKHYSKRYRWLVLQLVMFGIWLKARLSLNEV